MKATSLAVRIAIGVGRGASSLGLVSLGGAGASLVAGFGALASGAAVALDGEGGVAEAAGGVEATGAGADGAGVGGAAQLARPRPMATLQQRRDRKRRSNRDLQEGMATRGWGQVAPRTSPGLLDRRPAEKGRAHQVRGPAHRVLSRGGKRG